MARKRNVPVTGATPQNSPVGNVLTNPRNPSSEAERLVERPPMPFQTRQGPAMMPANAGPQKGIGNGLTKNTAGISGKSPASEAGLSATGDRVPGGNEKVTGGRFGTSHPRKQGPFVGGAKRNFSFFGGR